MQTQKRIKGYSRRKFTTAVESLIERAVERECKRYDVSRSFVIANALAYTFGIDVTDYSRKNGKKRK